MVKRPEVGELVRELHMIAEGLRGVIKDVVDAMERALKAVGALEWQFHERCSIEVDEDLRGQIEAAVSYVEHLAREVGEVRGRARRISELLSELAEKGGI